MNGLDYCIHTSTYRFLQHRRAVHRRPQEQVGASTVGKRPRAVPSGPPAHRPASIGASPAGMEGTFRCNSSPKPSVISLSTHGMERSSVYVILLLLLASWRSNVWNERGGRKTCCPRLARVAVVVRILLLWFLLHDAILVVLSIPDTGDQGSKQLHATPRRCSGQCVVQCCAGLALGLATIGRYIHMIRRYRHHPDFAVCCAVLCCAQYRHRFISRMVSHVLCYTTLHACRPSCLDVLVSFPLSIVRLMSIGERWWKSSSCRS